MLSILCWLALHSSQEIKKDEETLCLCQTNKMPSKWKQPKKPRGETVIFVNKLQNCQQLEREQKFQLKNLQYQIVFDKYPYEYVYLLVTATSSGILKAKQKLGRTFNSNKLGGIAFTKISKLTMCSA